MRKITVVVGLAFVVAVVVGGVVLSGVFEPDYEASVVDAQGYVADEKLLQRGKYLAQAADCVACHTTDKGAPLAGGVPLATPFGTIYGTNITPDMEYGIGGWNSADFYKVLHDGIAPEHALYPAMPYASYRGISREDSDAIFVWLQSQPPAAVANKENTVPFPLSVRALVRGWNLLFLTDELPAISKGDSEQWLRGRELVNVLGHCAECHTPRGMFGQMKLGEFLQGGDAEEVHAPDITPQALATRGWTADTLRQFLATGISSQGAAYGSMYDAYHHSTQYLTPDDNKAAVTYLMGDVSVAPVALREPTATQSATVRNGRAQYLALCAACHGAQGEGKPNVTVALAGNSTVRNEDPHNLLEVMLHGVSQKDFSKFQTRQEMPGFAHALDDTGLADLANYLRVSFGGQEGGVSAKAVAAVRQ